MKIALIWKSEMPNLFRAEHGRLAFEIYANIGPNGHTESFEGRVRWRYSNRMIERRTFGGRVSVRRWLLDKANNAGSDNARPARAINVEMRAGL